MSNIPVAAVPVGAGTRPTVQSGLEALYAQDGHGNLISYHPGPRSARGWAAALLLNTASFTGSIAGSTLTVSAIASGVLALGAAVSGAAAGTIITAFGASAGGVGAYTVSVSQTLASLSLATLAGGDIIMGGPGDSLREGISALAGNNITEQIRCRLYEKFGNYGGPGWNGCGTAHIQVERPGAVSITSGLHQLDSDGLSMNWGTAPYCYTLDGSGVYAAAAGGAEKITDDMQRPWDVGWGFFVAPAAGTFSGVWYLNNNATQHAFSFTATAAGQEFFIPTASSSANGSMVIWDLLTGPILYIGHWAAFSKNPNGVRIGTIAKGGRKMSDFAALNASVSAAFYAKLQPKAVFSCIGTNDDHTNVTAFVASYTAYLENIRTAWPFARLCIHEPVRNIQSDAAATQPLFDAFRDARLQLVQSGVADYYYDDSAALGSFAHATAQNQMFDETHYNYLGVQIVTNAFALDVFGAPPASPSFRYPLYGPAFSDFRLSEGGNDPSGDVYLQEREIASTASSASPLVWNIGIPGGALEALIKISASIINSADANARSFWDNGYIWIQNSGSTDGIVTNLAIYQDIQEILNVQGDPGVLSINDASWKSSVGNAAPYVGAAQLRLKWSQTPTSGAVRITPHAKVIWLRTPNVGKVINDFDIKIPVVYR